MDELSTVVVAVGVCVVLAPPPQLTSKDAEANKISPMHIVSQAFRAFVLIFLLRNQSGSKRTGNAMPAEEVVAAGIVSVN